MLLTLLSKAVLRDGRTLIPKTLEELLCTDSRPYLRCNGRPLSVLRAIKTSSAAGSSQRKAVGSLTPTSSRAPFLLLPPFACSLANLCGTRA